MKSNPPKNKPPRKSLGQVASVAYYKAANIKTALSTLVNEGGLQAWQNKNWQAAARAVVREFNRRNKKPKQQGKI